MMSLVAKMYSAHLRAVSACIIHSTISCIVASYKLSNNIIDAVLGCTLEVILCYYVRVQHYGTSFFSNILPIGQCILLQVLT